jgi:hypothetical protein
MFRICQSISRDFRSRGQHLVNEAVGRAARKPSYQPRSGSVMNVRVFPSFTSESGLAPFGEPKVDVFGHDGRPLKTGSGNSNQHE